MRDDQIIDEIIECLELLASTPATPPNPNTSTILSKVIDLKATSTKSKKRFADFFSNLSQVIKQISND